jgi:hypothetical protein
VIPTAIVGDLLVDPDWFLAAVDSLVGALALLDVLL